MAGGADGRVRCWAAAQRYRDALDDIGEMLSEADAIRKGEQPPMPSFGKNEVSLGRGLSDIEELLPERYENLVRAREDAKACGVSDHVFSFIDKVVKAESLGEVPSDAKETSQKLNTVLELESDVREFGDDLYHSRPEAE